MNTDVVVIGGGGSGLSAAITAAQAGARVVLLEKNPKLGGTTACSIGSISATGTAYQKRMGIVDEPQAHFEDLALFNQEAKRPDNTALSRILVDNVPDTFRWLNEAGIEFFGPSEELPHRQPRMHNVMPNSRAYIYHLERLARGAGVEIRTDCRALRFLTEGDEVTGVEYMQAGRKQTLLATRSVVLASGDYAGDPQFRREFMGDKVARLEPINPTNTGDGHRMALQLGAKILNGELWSGGMRFTRPAKLPWTARLPPYQWLMRSANIALRVLPEAIVRKLLMGFLTTVLVPTPKLYKAGAIIVNRNGQRFADETQGMPYNLASQPDAAGFIIFDGAIGEKFSKWPNYVSTAPGVAYAFLKDYARNRPDLYHRADTLEALAAQLGMPPAKLAATVSAYNASNVQCGTPEGLPARGERAALSAGPWYALGPCRNYIHYTDGGLAINEGFQVLRENGTPIPRLLAAGNAGQGGALLKGHGHHLAWAFTSGRLAGRRAAALAPRTLRPGTADTTPSITQPTHETTPA
ncbi:MAG TPA: FAD-dependent oxidoreductase [Ramlibacter sp.]|nr:FAD-dependent oxidoreductase [Ramlibacter sp.]